MNGVRSTLRQSSLCGRLGIAAFFLWAALVMCWSPELNAQSVRLRPHAGLYVPTRISLQSGVLHLRQKLGVEVGARLTVTVNDRADVVTAVNYIPGYITLHKANRQMDAGTSAHLLTATTNARYWLLPPGGALSWEVKVGLGAVFGGQPAYEDLFERSTVNGVIGTTLGYQIGQIARLHLRIQERVFRIQVGDHPSGSPNALKVSLGVSLPFLESTLLRMRPI